MEAKSENTNHAWMVVLLLLLTIQVEREITKVEMTELCMLNIYFNQMESYKIRLDSIVIHLKIK